MKSKDYSGKAADNNSDIWNNSQNSSKKNGVFNPDNPQTDSIENSQQHNDNKHADDIVLSNALDTINHIIDNLILALPQLMEKGSSLLE